MPSTSFFRGPRRFRFFSGSLRCDYTGGCGCAVDPPRCIVCGAKISVCAATRRRVMRAWWSSRSSKPSPRHFVPGGRFDSYPLRHHTCTGGLSTKAPCDDWRGGRRHWYRGNGTEQKSAGEGRLDTPMTPILTYRPTMRTWIWSVLAILAWALFALALDKLGHVVVPPMWILAGACAIIILATVSEFRFPSAGR
jgi:hypothetical protein